MITNTLKKDVNLTSQIIQEHVTSRKMVRTVLLMKYGTLTKAAEKLCVGYSQLSDSLNGRRQDSTVIIAIQQDLNLSDESILNFWPLLKQWPREEEVA